MGFDLDNIGGEAVEPIAGFRKIAYIANVNDFLVIQEPPALEGFDGESAELVTISQAHTFKPGKGFTKMEMVTETGTLAYAGIGNRRGRLFSNTATMKIQGSKAEILAFARKVKNPDYIVLMQEMGSAQFRQIGSAIFGAWFSEIAGALEGLAEGENSVTFTVMDKGLMPAPIYTAVITERPADASARAFAQEFAPEFGGQ